MAKKINLGSKLALYPTPVTVIGADVNGKVNWLEISHVGIVSHDRVLVSMAKPHYTTPALGIGKRMSLSLSALRCLIRLTTWVVSTVTKKINLKFLNTTAVRAALP